MKIFFVFFLMFCNSPSYNHTQKGESFIYLETLYELMDADQFYLIDSFSNLVIDDYKLLMINYFHRWKSKAVKNSLLELFHYIKNFSTNSNEEMEEKVEKINEKLLIEDEGEAKKFLEMLEVYHKRNITQLLNLEDGSNVSKKRERQERAELNTKKNKTE